MSLSRILIGMIFVLAGIILIIISLIESLFLLIYGIPILIVGLFIVFNKKEEQIEERQDLNKIKLKK